MHESGRTTNAMQHWWLRSTSRSSHNLGSPQFKSSSAACEAGKPSADSEPPLVSASDGITCSESRERLHSGASPAIKTWTPCPASWDFGSSQSKSSSQPVRLASHQQPLSIRRHLRLTQSPAVKAGSACSLGQCLHSTHATPAWPHMHDND